jgi:hypothetical protein
LSSLVVIFLCFMVCLVTPVEASQILVIRTQSDLDKNWKSLQNYRVIEMGPGTFKLNKTLRLSSEQSLSGYSTHLTRLIYEGKNKPAIEIRGQMGEGIGEVSFSKSQPEDYPLFQLSGFGQLEVIGSVKKDFCQLSRRGDRLQSSG